MRLRSQTVVVHSRLLEACDGSPAERSLGLDEPAHHVEPFTDRIRLALEDEYSLAEQCLSGFSLPTQEASILDRHELIERVRGFCTRISHLQARAKVHDRQTRYRQQKR